MTHKAIWISFDLGLKGDYKGLYEFLDNHKAVECGQGLAFISYQLIDTSKAQSIIEKISKELKTAVNLSKSDRIYLIWRDQSEQKIKGEFINGFRKQSPWEGYGKLKDESKPDLGE